MLCDCLVMMKGTLSSLAHAAAVSSNFFWETRCSRYFDVTCSQLLLLSPAHEKSAVTLAQLQVCFTLQHAQIRRLLRLV